MTGEIFVEMFLGPVVMGAFTTAAIIVVVLLVIVIGEIAVKALKKRNIDWLVIAKTICYAIVLILWCWFLGTEILEGL